MNDTTLMGRCIELAMNGHGYVAPNPLVGAVITRDEVIIGEGWHAKLGDVHAEIAAMRNADTTDFSGATLYCNLEPCSHQNDKKINPPCAPEIVNAGFERVVIGMTDPNPDVNGQGVAYLRDHGIHVDVGIRESECRYINRFFVTNMERMRPFLTLKMAQSLDGFVQAADGRSQWITGESARTEVHRMRQAHDAVLTTAATVLADNPSLTVRLIEGRNPLRVVIDTHNRLTGSEKLFQDNEAKTIVATANPQPLYGDAEVMPVPARGEHIDFEMLIDQLYAHGVRSVMIESGAELASELISQRWIDELVLMIAPKLLGNGTSAFQAMTVIDLEAADIFSDIHISELDRHVIFKGMLRECSLD